MRFEPLTIVLASLVLAPSVWAQAPLPCVGDCNTDGQVTVEEIVTGVNVALGNADVEGCTRFDRNDDGAVTVDEIVAAVGAALNGCIANRAPEIGSLPVYRTFPGFEIAVPLIATDADGDDLSFAVTELPDGATFDPNGAIVRWTPTEDDFGPTYLHYDVTDNGAPPATTTGVLPIKVSPLDACIDPTCDPATGCRAAPVEFTGPCCSGEPAVRVAEPEASCDGGRVAFLGRNQQGFGRIQNCDRLRILSFAQGGLVVRFHVEARCLDPNEPVSLKAEMRTLTTMLVDRSRQVTMDLREDGFLQELTLVYSLPVFVDPATLDGAEAQLTVLVEDAQGNTVEESVRVILTFDELADLPNPDSEDISPSEAGCVGCHRPVESTGERVGIEEAHPWSELACTDCHGGNGAASSRDEAHVSPGDGPAFLRNLTSDQLDAVDPAYIRFINPGDFRVVSETCGSQGCHVTHAENAPLSTMSTFGGHYTLPRYLAGSQDRTAQFAAVDVVNASYDPNTAPEGAIQSFTALREPHPDVDRATVQGAVDIYLPKSCPTCHLNDFGRNNASGNYRSSGCTACHMVYDDDGRSDSDDPVISRDFPPHPIKHELTTRIPTEQCAHCHFQGGRIGLAYRGIREGGFGPEATPEFALSLGVPLHAHDADFYFVDEDFTNGIDETPPDLHATAGMVCMDCHVGGDVHGDGNLYSSERHQVGVECEDCHGSVRAEISEDPDDGLFKTSKGFALKRLRRRDDNEIVLQLAMQRRELVVPQIHRLIEQGHNPLMNDAMAVKDGFTHTDHLECYTCHTSWRLTCVGCHVTVDDSLTARNQTTGLQSQGAIFAERDNYSIDFFALGLNEEGKISPLCNSMSLFVSYVDGEGVTVFRDQVRTSGDGRVGFGWNPFHHHTVSKTPINCDRCHPAAAELGIDNTDLLNETYGFGTGEFLATDGDGVEYDLMRILDGDINAPGGLSSDFPHPNTGPVPADVRERALAVEVFPHPR